MPVDTQAKTSNPNSNAFVAVTVTGLSLKENVGLTLSFLIYKLFNPNLEPRFSALVNGVNPVPISTAFSRLTGKKASYLHTEKGPASILSLEIFFLIDS